MQVTAAVVREPEGAFRLETLELDAPRPDEVLVKIAVPASATPTCMRATATTR